MSEEEVRGKKEKSEIMENLFSFSRKNNKDRERERERERYLKRKQCSSLTENERKVFESGTCVHHQTALIKAHLSDIIHHPVYIHNPNYRRSKNLKKKHTEKLCNFNSVQKWCKTEMDYDLVAAFCIPY